MYKQLITEARSNHGEVDDDVSMSLTLPAVCSCTSQVVGVKGAQVYKILSRLKLLNVDK